jgi:hypothetical protein
MSIPKSLRLSPPTVLAALALIVAVIALVSGSATGASSPSFTIRKAKADNYANPTCPPGAVATGGGARSDGGSLEETQPSPDRPGDTPTSWTARTSFGQRPVIAWVVCMKP